MVMDYLFDWMIVVNLIVVILNIEKQVLTNLKSGTGVEKIFFFDRNYVSISGK
jgi:ABC-type polysaccharide transport system permease subunit